MRDKLVDVASKTVVTLLVGLLVGGAVATGIDSLSDAENARQIDALRETINDFIRDDFTPLAQEVAVLTVLQERSQRDIEDIKRALEIQ